MEMGRICHKMLNPSYYRDQLTLQRPGRKGGRILLVQLVVLENIDAMVYSQNAPFVQYTTMNAHTN
jgi:hypothetical protein